MPLLGMKCFDADLSLCFSLAIFDIIFTGIEFSEIRSLPRKNGEKSIISYTVYFAIFDGLFPND